MLIAAVVFINLLCAVEFILKPAHYVPGFELPLTTGEAVVRGFGILFLMWNVPYLVTLWNPIHNRTSFYESIIMQFIGLVGEAYILQTIPRTYALAHSTIMRFILFDALGLAILLFAFFLSRTTSANLKKPL